MNKKSFKLMYGYFLIILIIGVYIHTNILSYQKKFEIKNNEREISDLQMQVDSLNEDINGVISIDILKSQYPDLKLNDNVFYLEENNE
jgi:hypothetical protein